MNKKFSTFLCASLLLASAFTTANAADLTGVNNGADAFMVSKLDKAALSGLYQLRVTSTATGNTTNGVLAIENGKYVVKASNYNLLNSLWCITITEQGQGKEPIYDFVNKATGEFLAINEADVQGLAVNATSGALQVGETYGGWAFARTYKEVLEKNQPMFTYQEADYVLILLEDNGVLKAKKVLASEARGLTDAVKFTVYDAGTYVLSADEINAYLKDNKNVLNFNQDANADVNPFTTKAFVAKELKGGLAADHNFVYVTDKENENSYLKVDTAANGVGIQFLKFGWTNAEKEPNKDVENSTLANQHKFLFSYKPSTDSLFIQVKQVRYKNEKNAEKYWKDVTDIKNYGSKYVGVSDTDVNLDNNAVAEMPGDAVAPSQLFVKLQNFTVADRIATIGARPINTHIGFGLKGCNAASDKTSIANGLYIIKNAKGQVLAAPIHENDNVGNNKVEWVTLDEQDPMHMPAYQWVITKTLNSEASQATSPIKVVNREFLETYNNVQLRLNDKNEIDASYDLLDGVTFVQITDSAIIKDKKLGYKYLAKNELIVNKYKFNYLNPFTQDYWIANGADKDSLIYVKEAANEYTLTEGSTAEYGIDVDATLLKKIPGLAQLERTNYVIAKNKTAKLVKAYGSKYSMGAANYGTVAEVDTFFFKENNHYDGKHYYAILETAYDNTKHAAYIDDLNEETSKVGIADDGMTAGLKVQLLNESRTSAFTVEPSDAPLYRRFNKAVLGENVNDGADSLAFVERYRHEYLMDETNANFEDKNGVVDYLGIWNKDKANGKLAMRIDTAWLNRGAGNVKPQYLISVARDDQGAIETIPCDEADDKHFYIDENGNAHKTDKWHCQHAKPGRAGFAYGKYLVSFADSARADKDKPYMDIKNGYTRVGFVEGIRVADTLWILPAEFVALANDKISFDALEAYNDSVKNLASKSYLIKNRLDGDDHKNYTWSFRYVHPENAGNVTEEGVENQFLFESNNYDNKIIAPENAAWLKIQNGCVVLTDKSSTFSHAATGGDGALIFNVENKVDDQLATDNEEIATSEVTVIALQGAVRVANAEGKKVVITNILGQTVANTVITSSDATIAAPQGVVVVAVEGEEAVKAIVK